eukprot:CAMPEP_0202865752 /NCGR_PEP_ID=MMETSP1391-20130828/6336_1 /ASSEMBLY_ACC=CAM_ASM_000867 /TAXON_ID=1034604 /ORGANISM="Chlamydomonas leiostraca, Strain SAG 11-49" /LENGTH=79 /DNA_ID=CAMNT_0049545629 /DNA_START=274 /DNA_END=513 /DNA_ORIENTATION=-
MHAQKGAQQYGATTPPRADVAARSEQRQPAPPRRPASTSCTQETAAGRTQGGKAASLHRAAPRAKRRQPTRGSPAHTNA